MRLTHALRRLVEQVADVHIYRALPRGVDVAEDIARSFPAYRVTTVFDVGANVGQSARHYLSCFPDADIYSFEPVRETFRDLQRNLQGRDRVHCFPLALGARRTVGHMALQGKSARFRLVAQDAVSRPGDSSMTEEVEVLPMDEFCDRHRIHRVSYLKIDTEGADLDVLKGAAGLLDAQRVDFVEVEAGMNAGNTWHVPFETLKAYLESRNYLLFGIYAQMHEWPTKEAHLRRTNSTFISRQVVEAQAIAYKA
jgi:FkbM family methyltransferase